MEHFCHDPSATSTVQRSTPGVEEAILVTEILSWIAYSITSSAAN